MSNKQKEEFDCVIKNRWEEYKHKLKKWSSIVNIDWDEDVMIETYVKIVDKIQKTGLKATTEQEYLNYFFQAFKFNLLQENIKKMKKIDLNINIEDFDSIEEDEEVDSFSLLARNILEQAIADNFDTVSYGIFRLRYLYTINGKNLNFKQIKEITKVKDTRKRLVEMLRFLRDNYPKERIKEIIKSKKIFQK